MKPSPNANTVQTAQYMSEKNYPKAGPVLTRKMTTEEREKYKPVRKEQSK